MKRKRLTILVVTAWLASMTWLIFFEACPGLLSRTAAGYRAVMPDDLLVMDRWMKVSFNDTPIGYSHTRIRKDEEKALGPTLVHNDMVLHLKVMSQSERIKVTARATLDPAYQLTDFFFVLTSRATTFGVEGRRTGSEEFDVTLRTGGTSRRMQLRIPPDAIVHTPMMELAVGQFKPGRQVTLRVFNPLSLTADEMHVKALRKTSVTVNGSDVTATILSAEVQGMEITSWVDGHGRILRQESPLGLRLEACTVEEALALDKAQAADAADLLTSTAVPLQGRLLSPRTRARLTVHLRGGPFEAGDVTSHRQRVLRETPEGVILELQRDKLPPPPVRPTPVPEDAAAHLAPTPFIQADAARVRDLARELVGQATHRVEAAGILYEWVHDNMRRSPSVSVPSALEILERMEGDCNEHTTLFVALARAAGLPAKVTVGLVYNRGAFYYHAWPAVYVGRWLEMDPTLGQPAVDATHIRLLEGDLSDQLGLMRLVGRLSVELLEGPSS